MEEIAHDPADNGGVPVKRGAVTMKDITNLEGQQYGVDDSGRTIVPRTTLAGGVEGSTNPFGHDIQFRTVDQDEDGMHIVGKKVVTGLGETVQQADAQVKVEDKPMADSKLSKKKRPDTTGRAQELEAKVAELEKLIAARPAVVAAPAVAKAPVMVSLSGAFGSMSMPYYEVLDCGAFLVLVSEDNPGVPRYTPPERVPIEVDVGGRKTKVMHLGIGFGYAGKSLMVLIVDS